MTWKLPVRVFARLRELAGTDVINVTVPNDATVADVRTAVERLWPQASALLANSAVAVNNEYADADHPIQPRDEVALIPPVSGGT
jgi:molybdopterin converting factor subunit 1